MFKHRRASVAALSLLGALLAAPTAARAQRPAEPWFTDLELATEAPLSAGGRLVVESPSRFRLGVGVGVVPQAYVEFINQIALATGGYDEETGEVVTSSISRSVVFRVDLGWKPIPGYGFYVQGGYRRMRFGGEVGGSPLFALIEEAEPAQPDFYTYDVESTLHALDVELGWQWLLPAQLTLRAGLGFAATLGAEVKVEPLRAIDLYRRDIEETLTDVYGRYGFAPTLVLAAGVRLD